MMLAGPRSTDSHRHLSVQTDFSFLVLLCCHADHNQPLSFLLQEGKTQVKGVLELQLLLIAAVQHSV